jgi:hypothetical protein
VPEPEKDPLTILEKIAAGLDGLREDLKPKPDPEPEPEPDEPGWLTSWFGR